LLKIERSDALEQLGLAEQLTRFIPAIQQCPLLAGGSSSRPLKAAFRAERAV
jgi:hypothetical protein